MSSDTGSAPADPPGSSTAPAAEPLHEVDAARARLLTLDHAPVSEHPAVYDEIHGVLQTTLAGLDER